MGDSATLEDSSNTLAVNAGDDDEHDVRRRDECRQNGLGRKAAATLDRNRLVRLLGTGETQKAPADVCSDLAHTRAARAKIDHHPSLDLGGEGERPGGEQ